jgi:hypothetical protein
MARKIRATWRRTQVASLLRGIARRWGRGARRTLPPEVRAHLQAAVREGLLALASLCEELVRGVEGRARRARSRVKRIAVRGAVPSRRERQRRRRAR